MKKVIFMMALLVSIGTLYAQQPGSKGKGKGKEKSEKGKSQTPEDRAERITSRLKTELSLTEEQTPKVKQATLTRVTQVAAAKTKAGEDKKAFGQERKKIFQTWETEMKGILTPEQFNSYLAKKEEKKKKMQENKGSKKAGEVSEEGEDIGE